MILLKEDIIDAAICTMNKKQNKVGTKRLLDDFYEQADDRL